MSTSPTVWRIDDIARVYGLEEPGFLAGDVYCLNSPLGPVTTGEYRGSASFLDWLGASLEILAGKTSRLTLSRLLQVEPGRYHVSAKGALVMLSTWELGPTCDAHNSFELFSITAGVAHVHKRFSGSGPLQTAVSRSELYRRKLKEAAQVERPAMPRRNAALWDLVLEAWRLCAEEAISRLEDEEIVPTLILGLEGFQDFVYLVEPHLVHYNGVANCRIDSPLVELAKLLWGAEGDRRTIEAILHTYGRVFPLNQSAKKQLLGHMWFPHEVSLTELLSPDISIFRLRTMQRQLEERAILLADLEESWLDQDELDEFVSLATDAEEGKEKTEEVGRPTEAQTACAPDGDCQEQVSEGVVSSSEEEHAEVLDSVEVTEKMTFEHEWTEKQLPEEEALHPTQEPEAKNEAKEVEPVEQVEQEECQAEEQEPEVKEPEPENPRIIKWKPFPKPIFPVDNDPAVERPIEVVPAHPIEEPQEKENDGDDDKEKPEH